MKILLLNPPHKAIGSRMAREHLPPLGLLSIAGPLIDAGYYVRLLDTDFDNLTLDRITSEIKKISPDIILLGHAGSSSAQPIIDNISKGIKLIIPNVKIILGGVFPTYHYSEILQKNKNIDIIVCGEGEQTTLDLIQALHFNQELKIINGIVFRDGDHIVKTPPTPTIQILDDYRIAWELMEDYKYTYWGHKKAVVIQFSRGCPHSCSYCGQNLFWKKWRHRDPQHLADEIEMLYHQYGIQVINFADENPATNQKIWIKFLELLIEKQLDLSLIGSIRADDIVRDEKYLHIYKKAGFERFLLGIESYNEEVLNKIHKSSTISKDKQAIQLLRKHNILSMATYVVGFSDEKTKDFIKNLKHLLDYDPDQIQLLYVTPHKWTPYYNAVKDNDIIQLDQSKWDYKHQVLKMKHLSSWQVILYVKLIELIMQTRPKALYRWLFHKDKRLRKAMFWYNNIGKRVWFYELFEFIFTKRDNKTKKVSEFWFQDT